MVKDLIQEARGHSFRRVIHQESESASNYYFACSQDEDKNNPLEHTSRRNRCRIERFHCESKLVIKLNLLNQRLAVKLQHTYHTPYLDIGLLQEPLDFVNASCLYKTSFEILVTFWLFKFLIWT